MYRGGLYLLGRSYRGAKIVTLAVERIRRAERVPERFEYPKRYSPQEHTVGSFGIMEGPETKVELLIMNLSGQIKTGQSSTPENRPVEAARLRAVY